MQKYLLIYYKYVCIFGGMSNQNVKNSVAIMGGPTKAAAKLSEITGCNVIQQRVSAWITSEKVPPEFAPFIEELTAKKGSPITKEELCPDFPWAKCCKHGCIKESAA